VPEETANDIARTVLLVGDHPAVLEGLAGIVRAAGYTVVETVNAEQATAVASSEQPDFVLVDVVISGVLGLGAIVPLVASYPDSRVLLLSVDDSPETIRAAMRAGAIGYLSKMGTSGSLLIQALRRVAAGEAVFVPVELGEALVSYPGSFPSAAQVLNEREVAVAALVAAGKSNRQIAQALFLSPRTVEAHVTSIFVKLGVTSRTQLAVAAVRRQIGERMHSAQMRGLMFADIVAFSARAAAEQIAIRRAFARVLQDACTQAGLPWAECRVEDRGDGALVLLPPDAAVSKLIDPFPQVLGDRLESYNRAAAGPENMQIRVALHEGPVSVDDMGISGQTVIHCARLLDAAVFRSAMHASGSAVGVIASELVHDLAVSQGARMPDPASVQHVGIRAKELETTAWMWFSGNAIPPALRPSAPRAGRVLAERTPDSDVEPPQGMQFRLLGPLEVQTPDGWAAISAAKWRSLLACLLLRPGELVPTETLISELWGDAPPNTANNLVSIYVHRLKKMIGDTDGQVLVYRKPGYLLRLPDGATDAQWFETMIRGAREALSASDPQMAANRLEEALALWRGPLLSDVPATPLITSESERFAELRLEAAGLNIAVDIDRGRGDQAIPELRELLDDHPLREELWLLLMRALAETGQRAEALAAYDQARELVLGELGVELGAALNRLYADLLARNGG
jgi:DNA-binding NarL/FixJ family response regulator/DNA-binding SARP family transcriptional activator